MDGKKTEGEYALGLCLIERFSHTIFMGRPLRSIFVSGVKTCFGCCFGCFGGSRSGVAVVIAAAAARRRGRKWRRIMRCVCEEGD